MVRFNNSLVINTDIQDVFDFLGKIENFSIWNWAVQKISKVYSTGNVVSSRYHLYRSKGLQAFEEITIKEYIPYRRLSFEAVGDYFSYTMTYDLTPQSQNQTILTNTAEITPPGVNRFIFTMFQENIKNAVNQNLHVLKEMLENSSFVTI